MNGHGNVGLLAGTSGRLAKKGIALSQRSTNLIQKQGKGPIDLDALTGLIREIADASE
jgi:hypothetical protein